MATTIKCPGCGFKFPLADALSDEQQAMVNQQKEAYRQQMIDFKQKKEEELATIKKQWEQDAGKKEQEYLQKLNTEKKQLQLQIEEQVRKTVAGDFENQLKILQQQNASQEERLKLSREKELAHLRREQEIMAKEADLEITLQKKLSQERERLSGELRKIEAEKAAHKETEYQLQLRELQKQLDDQKKLASEMKRKAEQGSMQLQGETQELALEEMLAVAFPFDVITEVGKGVRGADCMQTIRNSMGMECGKIIWESKRAEHFGGEWIEKLKADMRSTGADVAILVTRRLPKDMQQFGEKEGVWICNFNEAVAVASLLRDGIIRIHKAATSQENKGEKMNLLYHYLTSPEFAEQWKAIREGFLNMKISIQRERDAMERLWKAREKQLEKVLLNATHIRGSIDGISGLESVDLNLLDYEE